MCTKMARPPHDHHRVSGGGGGGGGGLEAQNASRSGRMHT